jgi:hypothetical protein
VTALLRQLWARLPPRAVRAATATGLPYVASFISRYGDRHRVENFAGSLEQLQQRYVDASDHERAQLSRRFDSILDTLVLPNAVTKTTYANRLAPSVARALSAVRLPSSEIRVLDVPSSTGIASLQNLAILQQSYRVTSYVLGDLFHELVYDPERGCVFDKQERLLQVARRKSYFSIYRGHVFGNEHTALSACLLFPHSAIAWYLRKRYRFNPGSGYRRLLVVHPEVRELLGRSVFQLQEMDVFAPVPGQYELILSFNLLQKNYFPAHMIQAGIDNLAASLTEGGVLVIGNTESFVALQKQDGRLIARAREGSF